jgi:hypothetical protein
MDEGNFTAANDLPHLFWRDNSDGLAQHAIRQSESVSDDAAGLSDGVSGPDIAVPSGSGHGHLGIRSPCCQTDRVVLLIRAAITRFLESRETTWTVVLGGFVWIGDSDVAVGGKVEAKVEVERGRVEVKVEVEGMGRRRRLGREFSIYLFPPKP